MAVATPELFADKTCGRPLPAGELLQQFRFGQFCPLLVLDGSSEATVVLGEEIVSEDRAQGETQSFRADGAPSITGRDRVAFAELLQMESATTPVDMLGGARMAMATTTKQNGGGGGDGGGRGGGGGTASGGGGGSSGGSKKGGANALYHEVSQEDLLGYLMSPWVMTDTGQRITFSMTAQQVEDLKRNGSVSLQVGQYWVTVSLKTSKPKGPSESPVTTSSTTTTTTSDPKKQGQVYNPSRLLTPADFRGVVLALYFEWKQSWTLKGFSRGRLLQSLALAPQEETTIELFTWDRRKKTLEQSSSTETEQSMEDEEKSQDSAEVFRELTKKEEFEIKGGASVDLQYSPGPVKIKVGANIDVRDKTNADSVARSTTKAIREGVQKSSARVKVARSSKVTETTETGSEQRITRKIRNPNLCHTLNLDYYEILTHYAITTEFNEAGMRFCAMVPNPVAEQHFSRPFIRQHEGPLRDALLDRSLGSGFDAVRLLRAREVAIEELEARRDRREKEPLPAPPASNATPQGGISNEESAANNYLANLQASARKLMDENLAAGLDQALTCIGDHDKAKALGTVKGRPLPDDLNKGKRWLAQQLFLRSFSQLALALGELATATDGPQIREWGPRLESVVPQAASMPKPSQLNLEPQEVREGLLSPAMWTPTGPFHVKHNADWGWWWAEIRRVGLLEAEDAGLGALVEQFAKVYKAFLDAAKGKAGEDQQTKLLEQQQKNQDRLSDEDRLENDFPMRDCALAKERAEVLERHLQEHAEHYSFALFLALPPQEQLNHIEQTMGQIATGFDPGFFQPRVVSQIGSMLLVPLNHEVIDKAQSLLDMVKARIDVPTETDTVLLPSPGLTIDTRLGRCSGCEEFIEASRQLDLELRRAQVRQAAAEADRFEKRLSQSPPRLDDPRAPVPQLSVDIQRPAPA